MSKLSFYNIPCVILWLLFYLAATPAMCSSNKTDLESLVAIKKAIVSDPQGALTSWNETVHFCSWEGILCSRRHPGRVGKIDLTSRGLIGSLSPHLGNLSFLRIITLQHNSFYGQIPNEIGRLRRLQYVEFSNNSFSGEIPRNLSQCTNIIYLNLIDNNLTGIIIPELGSLLELEDLGLSQNHYVSQTIPQFIGNLTKLQTLSLQFCSLRGEIPSSLVQLQSLWFLSLEENNLSGRIPSGLYNISTMSTFSVFSNKLHGTIPSDIGFTLPNLIVFDLNSNYFTGAIPASLSNSSLIESIDISSNNITGKVMIDFTRLSALEEFKAWGNNVEGDLNFISSMSNCTWLKEIDVSDNILGGSLPNQFGNLSSQFSILRLTNNQLRGFIPSSIGNLVGLSLLSIGSNDFEGPIPFEMGKLKKLQEIDFGGNMLTNEIPFSFGNLTLLTGLFLGKNNIHGSIPQSLINCTNLLLLSLHNNNLSGSIPPEIMSISSISLALDLSYNSFTGTIPSEIGSLINLMILDLSHNRLSALIPDSLSQCIELNQIYLQNNFFSGQIPNALRSLKSVTYLDLSQNNLSGTIPSFLGDIKLVYLNLSFNGLQGQVPTLGVFQNESGVSLEGNNNLCGGIAILKLPSCSPNNSKKKHFSALLKILIPCAVVAIFISLSACFYILIYRKRILRNFESSGASTMADVLRLSYADLLKATGGFSASNLLGAGRFGSVYKGILDDTQDPVAVKVINLNIRGASRSFMSECTALRGIRHRNLVKIVSVCYSTDFRGNDFNALVYDFKANGNLDNWLHKKSESHSREIRKLGMRQRVSIAVDIACALDYLHCGTDSITVHGDLKPSNILLDENMTAHIGDFGLAKVFSNLLSTPENSSIGIKGTVGYIPPEYGMSGMVSVQGDVYSYGILLLELFTGIRPTDDSFEEYLTLHDFVRSALPSHVMDVLDPEIRHEQNIGMSIEVKTNCIISVLGIAVACSKELPSDRMQMGCVVNELHKIKDSIV